MSFALFIAYVLCTFLRPFETIAPSMASFRPMLILWLLAFVTASLRALARREIAARAAHIGLLAMLVTAIALSRVANQWAGGALPAVGEFSPAFMLMVLALLNLTSMRRLRITCAVIAGSVVVLAGLSAYSFHSGFMSDTLILRQTLGEDSDDTLSAADIEVDPAAYDATHLLRAQSVGFLNDPNDFAQTMVMALPLLWLYYVRGRWLRNLLVIGLPSAMLGYTIFLTHSRGALMGVAALGLLLMRRVLGMTKTLVIVGVMSLGVGVLSFGGRALSSKEQSAAQRIEAWQAGITMLRNEPALGVGFGNFTDHHYLTAHNSFVLCFAELGLLGYFAWLGLIVLTFKGLGQGYRATQAGTPERDLVVLLRAALIAFLTCAWFLSRTYSPGLFLLLGVCIAAWFVVRETDPQARKLYDEQALVWRKSTLLAMCGSFAAIYAFILVQRGN
jgi:putative inorganic carbon (hco3(-)) transporter